MKIRPEEFLTDGEIKRYNDSREAANLLLRYRFLTMTEYRRVCARIQKEYTQVTVKRSDEQMEAEYAR